MGRLQQRKRLMARVQRLPLTALSSLAADMPRYTTPSQVRETHPSRLTELHPLTSLGKVKTNDKNDRDRSRSPVIKHSTKDQPLAPEEVLFRRKGAPQRYEEHDIYLSHQRDLPRSGRGVLPDSDLLKAVHSYSSHYYGALKRSQGGQPLDERSMDETALLAFGILLEEAGREVLGRRGDLVFTEAAEPEEEKSSSGITIGYQTTGTELAHRRKRVKAESEPVDG